MEADQSLTAPMPEAVYSGGQLIEGQTLNKVELSN